MLSLLCSTKTGGNLVPKAVPASFRFLVSKQGGKQEQQQKIMLISSSIRNAEFGSKKNQCLSSGKKKPTTTNPNSTDKDKKAEVSKRT